MRLETPNTFTEILSKLEFLFCTCPIKFNAFSLDFDEAGNPGGREPYDLILGGPQHLSGPGEEEEEQEQEEEGVGEGIGSPRRNPVLDGRSRCRLWKSESQNKLPRISFRYEKLNPSSSFPAKLVLYLMLDGEQTFLGI